MGGSFFPRRDQPTGIAGLLDSALDAGKQLLTFP